VGKIRPQKQDELESIAKEYENRANIRRKEKTSFVEVLRQMKQIKIYIRDQANPQEYGVKLEPIRRQ
jgi:hypothetical protein